MAKKSPKGLSATGGGKKKAKVFGESDRTSNGGSGDGGGGGGGLGVSKGSPAFSAPRTSVRATTHKGRRVLAAREPQLFEDLKNTLLLFGKRTSQLVKDVMADLGTLKRGECLKLTRKNDDVLPFEAEGAARLEALACKGDAGLFVLGSHSKKRPHTLTLGRVFDGRLLDSLELHLNPEEGRCKLLKQYGAAPTAVAAGHKPCLFFVGGAFESDSAFATAKSLLLDLFRGRVVSKINLAGVDRVLVFAASDSSSASGDGIAGSGSRKEISIRQYAVALKKSGTRVPRVQLSETGPSLRASVGRHRPAPPDLWKAAMKQPEGVDKKKEKNVSSDLLDGRVGRVYVPRQDLAALPSAAMKMKGAKRERREGKEGGEQEEKRKKNKKAVQDE